jgi:hypothetical protein
MLLRSIVKITRTIYRLHLQGRILRKARNQHEASNKQSPLQFLRSVTNFIHHRIPALNKKAVTRPLYLASDYQFEIYSLIGLHVVMVWKFRLELSLLIHYSLSPQTFFTTQDC